MVDCIIIIIKSSSSSLLLSDHHFHHHHHIVMIMIIIIIINTYYHHHCRFHYSLLSVIIRFFSLYNCTIIHWFRSRMIEVAVRCFSPFLLLFGKAEEPAISHTPHLFFGRRCRSIFLLVCLDDYSSNDYFTTIIRLERTGVWSPSSTEEEEEEEEAHKRS